MNTPHHSEVDAMLGGHPSSRPAKDCSIPLPVRPDDQGKVDEGYRRTGLGSIDNVFGVDFNQQEE